MKRLFGKTFDILEKAIELRTRRNSLLAGNIANLDTPGYRARDIDFERIMSEYVGSEHRPSELLLSDIHHLTQDGELAADMPMPRNGAKVPDMAAGIVETGPHSLAVTDPEHFPAGAGEDNRGPVLVSKERGTPNNVDIDHEMAKLAENNLQYQAAVQALVKGFDLIRTAVTEGGKV